MNKTNRKYIEDILWFMASQIVRLFTKIKKGRIICWSYSGKQYSCNPKSLTEYLLQQHPGEYDIYWELMNGISRTGIPDCIKVVRPHTWRYIVAINTAEYIITNARTGILSHSWLKRRNQTYIMAWHASMGLKKIEGDIAEKLGKGYVKSCKRDSQWCDLIFSGCRFRSDTIRRAFWYDGEILEHGTPRNDRLFDTNSHAAICRNIREKYGIDTENKLVLYAPTFRVDGKTDYYCLDWTRVSEMFEKMMGKPVQLLIRMHPNLIGKVGNVTTAIGAPKAIDVTSYQDMHELLIAADVLITDYSSSIFDMALLRRPVFIYASDYASYDRGTYFQLDKLPYPFAENEQELIARIQGFDRESYQTTNEYFLQQTLGTFEQGKACERFYEWMKNREKE